MSYAVVHSRRVLLQTTEIDPTSLIVFAALFFLSLLAQCISVQQLRNQREDYGFRITAYEAISRFHMVSMSIALLDTIGLVLLCIPTSETHSGSALAVASMLVTTKLTQIGYLFYSWTFLGLPTAERETRSRIIQFAGLLVALFWAQQLFVLLLSPFNAIAALWLPRVLFLSAGFTLSVILVPFMWFQYFQPVTAPAAGSILDKIEQHIDRTLSLVTSLSLVFTIGACSCAFVNDPFADLTQGDHRETLRVVFFVLQFFTVATMFFGFRHIYAYSFQKEREMRKSNVDEHLRRNQSPPIAERVVSESGVSPQQPSVLEVPYGSKEEVDEYTPEPEQSPEFSPEDAEIDGFSPRRPRPKIVRREATEEDELERQRQERKKKKKHHKDGKKDKSRRAEKGHERKGDKKRHGHKARKRTKEKVPEKREKSQDPPVQIRRSEQQPPKKVGPPKASELAKLEVASGLEDNPAGEPDNESMWNISEMHDDLTSRNSGANSAANPDAVQISKNLHLEKDSVIAEGTELE